MIHVKLADDDIIMERGLPKALIGISYFHCSNFTCDSVSYLSEILVVSNVASSSFYSWPMRTLFNIENKMCFSILINNTRSLSILDCLLLC